MPTSTDLVTDLPADFEVFGQAVDTSLADLKGGTTGQILAKASNTNMDFTWVTNDIGDITAVTAGTGISGGGTSGAVTVSIDPLVVQTRVTGVTDTEIGYLDGVTSAIQTQLNTKQAIVAGVSDTEISYLDGVTSAIQTQINTKITNPLTTTGDVIYSSSGSTPARLGVGSAGQFLGVSGGVPSWLTPSAGGMTLIGTYTPSSTSFTISSIPQTYRSLFLVGNVALSASSSFLTIATNSNAAFFTGLVAGAAGQNNSGSILATSVSMANIDMQMTITNYTATGGNGYKPLMASGRANGGSGGLFISGGVAVSSTAITSITFSNPGGLTLSGSVSLFGVS